MGYGQHKAAPPVIVQALSEAFIVASKHHSPPVLHCSTWPLQTSIPAVMSPVLDESMTNRDTYRNTLGISDFTVEMEVWFSCTRTVQFTADLCSVGGGILQKYSQVYCIPVLEGGTWNNIHVYLCWKGVESRNRLLQPNFVPNEFKIPDVGSVA